MPTSRHTRTCDVLVKNGACSCGGVCPSCGARLPCRIDHGLAEQVDLDRIRARVVEGSASRVEAIGDARALLALVDKLTAGVGPPVS